MAMQPATVPRATIAEDYDGFSSTGSHLRARAKGKSDIAPPDPDRAPRSVWHEFRASQPTTYNSAHDNIVDSCYRLAYHMQNLT